MPRISLISHVSLYSYTKHQGYLIHFTWTFWTEPPTHAWCTVLMMVERIESDDDNHWYGLLLSIIGTEHDEINENVLNHHSETVVCVGDVIRVTGTSEVKHDEIFFRSSALPAEASLLQYCRHPPSDEHSNCPEKHGDWNVTTKKWPQILLVTE